MGRFDRVNRAALVPKPSRSIPIWLGGSGVKAFDRAARLGDGFIFFGAGGIDWAVEAWQSLQVRIKGLGRSTEQFGAEYVALTQGAENVVAESETWRAAGGTHFSIATMGFGLDSVQAHCDYAASVAQVLNTP
jgi:alkanesulfonate monooxygenase SsuD/methylene tetrahydromethanopterin reductase-like flavin-dependent oxidoreductase (luciferase family)